MKLSVKYWAGIIGVLLLVTWLGARKLNADGIWYDEWWSLYIAGADTFHVSRSVGDIWQRISTEDVWQAPFYAYALAGWGSVVGWTEFAVRALSLLAGITALAGVFRLGWTLAKHPAAGLGAAVLLGSSVWYIHFLHELRVYMLLVLLTVLMLLLYRRLMYGQRPARLWTYGALGVVSGLLANTHYFAVLAVGVLGLWHLSVLLRSKPNKRWWGVMGAWVVSALMLIPWLINVQRAAALARDQQRVVSDAALLLRIVGDSLTAFSNTSTALLILLLAFSLLARRARWLWLLGGVLLALNLAAYYIFGLPELRYNMAILPFLALLAGFGLDELRKRRIPAALVIGLWAAGMVTLEGNFQMARIIQHWPAQPIRAMAQTLAPQVEAGDVLINLIGQDDIANLASSPLTYYMGDFGARIEIVENNLRPGTQHLAARLREAVGEAKRAWLLYDPRWASADWSLAEYVLNEEGLYHCTTAADTGDMRIWGFGRVQPADTVWRYGESIRLSTISPALVRNGRLHLWLAYAIGDNTPANTYSVGVYLLDTGGQVQAQADIGLPSSGTSCQAFDLDVSSIAAGRYTLGAAIYQWQTGERLMSTAPDGSESDFATLSHVTLDNNH